MKKREFTSELLIPAPLYAETDFSWVDTFNGWCANGDNETVNVIAFNTEDKSEIKSILQREADRLSEIEKPSDVEKNNINYINMLLKEMAADVYEHRAPKNLIKTLCQVSGQTFTADDVIYLSGTKRKAV